MAAGRHPGTVDAGRGPGRANDAGLKVLRDDLDSRIDDLRPHSLTEGAWEDAAKPLVLRDDARSRAAGRPTARRIPSSLKEIFLRTAIPLCLAAAAASPAMAQDRPVLDVYTYDSFVSEWGPGPAIEQAFEATCACDLRFTALGDGAALLARLELEGARSDADVVLGLDTNLIAEAQETGLFAPSDLPETDWALPIDWSDDTFVPYDWGYFAFVHRAGFDAPTDFRALADGDASVVIQDPRSSTPGLGLLLWVKDAYGDEAPAIWEGLSDNIVTVTPGWSEAYNLFLEGEADMVLSYTTSPAYHLLAEEDSGFAAAPFDEGHYLQIEVAAAVAASQEPELARAFLAFLASDAAQSILPTTNWMYPAVMPASGLPDGFETLISPDTALLVPPGDSPDVTQEALSEWLSALGR